VKIGNPYRLVLANHIRATLKGGVMSKIKFLHDKAGNPDLSHWNDRKTFSISEAARLTVGVDPLESPVDWLSHLRSKNHPNWKHAAMIQRAMCEAICEGSMVVVKVSIYAGDFDEYTEMANADLLELSDAGRIAPHETIITRKALLDWYLKNGYSERKQNASLPQKQTPAPPEADSTGKHEQQQAPILLPGYTTPCLDLLNVHIEQNLAGVPTGQTPTPAEQREWLENQAKARGIGKREAEAIYTVARPATVKERATGKPPVHPKSK
jgi:hypothetical protein